MIRPNVHLIAAVGANGQIGLRGGLPWMRCDGDLPWFRAQTYGHVVIMGGRTADAVGELPGRRIARWDGTIDPILFLDELESQFKPASIFIGGGAHTYRAFAPFASKWLITRIDYDGPADTFWPFRLPCEER